MSFDQVEAEWGWRTVEVLGPLERHVGGWREIGVVAVVIDRLLTATPAPVFSVTAGTVVRVGHEGPAHAWPLTRGRLRWRDARALRQQLLAEAESLARR